MSAVTCVAPVNIAVIKYWGKRDEVLILPINDSISATLDTEQLCAKTTVMASPEFKENKIWLNNKEESADNVRLQNCIAEIKKRSQVSEEMKSWKIHICSVNNFPTAAGLASSAAGYACLASALSKLYKVEGDISDIARVGSGSACRSTQGGFVRWYKGEDPKGLDSISKQITPASHWQEMRILILVVNDAKKGVSSSVGMERSVRTSELLKYRSTVIVPQRAKEMQQAILDRDFSKFAELTMKDSNQFHAVCLDTYPPCVYMNDVSHSIVKFVHEYNRVCNEVKVAYTFDAGPNATLFLLEKDVSKVLGFLDYYFPAPASAGVEYKKGIAVQSQKASQDLIEKINFEQQKDGALKYIIHTRVGKGPQYLFDFEDHLLDNGGYPKKTQ